MADRLAHREICSLCHEVSRVSFWVPDAIWKAAMAFAHWNAVACLACFTRLADERGVEWCKEIRFTPESYASVLRRRGERKKE